MPIYIAMLRGINVGGHKIVSMERLRELFAGLGFGPVRTYVQSGNVIFKAGRNPAAMSKKIEAAMERDFGFSVSLVLRTSEEMRQVLQSNPFLRQEDVDITKLHVTFLSGAPTQSALEKVNGLSSGPDKFSCSGEEVYLYCPGGYGRTKLSTNALERALALRATTRNWKTVNQLYQMSVQKAEN